MLPPVIRSIPGIREAVSEARRDGRTIGLVPTMGALHTGHASLIRSARGETDFVVVSIFVNPTQFGPNEDLERYPRQLEADRQLCGAVGANVIFAPEPAEMYPPGFSTWVEVRELAEGLCGASRPGHFRGVATVVLKLFNIVQADTAYFGQKDAQQARIIQQIAVDLNLTTAVRVLPTIREPDGLAMSSRNRYLDPIQRRNAARLFQALGSIRQRAAAGERDVETLRQALAERLVNIPGARLDYASIVDAHTLAPVHRLDRPALAAVAVHFGTTRLIDNIMIDPPAEPRPPETL